MAKPASDTSAKPLPGQLPPPLRAGDALVTDVRLRCLELATKHGLSPIGGVTGAIAAAKDFENYVLGR